MFGKVYRSVLVVPLRFKVPFKNVPHCGVVDDPRRVLQPKEAMCCAARPARNVSGRVETKTLLGAQGLKSERVLADEDR